MAFSSYRARRIRLLFDGEFPQGAMGIATRGFLDWCSAISLDGGLGSPTGRYKVYSYVWVTCMDICV